MTNTEMFLLISLILNAMLVMVNGTVIGMYLDARYWRDVWRNASAYGHGAVLEKMMDDEREDALS